MKDLPPILLVRHLAEVLGISEHGVRAMLRRGEIPASRLGSRWVVRRDALERHLLRQERVASRQDRLDDAAAKLVRSLPPPRRRRLSS